MKRATVIGAGGSSAGARSPICRLGGTAAPARDDREFVHEDDSARSSIAPASPPTSRAGRTTRCGPRRPARRRARLRPLRRPGLSPRPALRRPARIRRRRGRRGHTAFARPGAARHLFDLPTLGESLCRQASGGRARIARLLASTAAATTTPTAFSAPPSRRLQPDRGAVLDLDSSAKRLATTSTSTTSLEALVAIAAAARGRSTTSPAASTSPTASCSPASASSPAASSRPARRTGALPGPVSIARIQGEFGWRPRPCSTACRALARRCRAEPAWAAATPC